MESIWWPEEQWWEKKAIPLGFVSLSLRQAATLAGGVLVGLVVSSAFNFPLAGISFGGRAVAFFFVVGVSYVVSVKRVRMVPLELQGYYFLKRNGIDALRARLHRVPLAKSFVKAPSSPSPDAPRRNAQEMVVDDFKHPMPLVISGKAPSLTGLSKVTLCVDGGIRAEETVAPEKRGYRLVYRPGPGDVGEHELTVRLDKDDGAVQVVLVTVELTIKARSADLARSVFKR